MTTTPNAPDAALLTNGQIGEEHFTPTADAARRIASYCEGDARKNVYKAALQELTAHRAGQSHADAALLAALEDGCPACSGDCGSANPPMIGCPMGRAQAGQSLSHAKLLAALEEIAETTYDVGAMDCARAAIAAAKGADQ